MTYDDYAALPGIRWSTLKAMQQSPRHYRHAVEAPREDTPALAFGRAVHAAVLEPDVYARDFVVFDGKTRRGKAWEAFKEENAHREIITADDARTIAQIREAVAAHPAAAGLLARGKPEVPVQWIDRETGLRCKCRLDWWTDGAIVDLKTAREIDARSFGRAVVNYGYAGQAAFYLDGLATVTGDALAFGFIAVEKSAPFDVAVYELDDEALRFGRMLYQGLLRRVAECEESGEWPGMSEGIQSLSLPRWAWNQQL